METMAKLWLAGTASSPLLLLLSFAFSPGSGNAEGSGSDLVTFLYLRAFPLLFPCLRFGTKTELETLILAFLDLLLFCFGSSVCSGGGATRDKADARALAGRCFPVFLPHCFQFPLFWGFSSAALLFVFLCFLPLFRTPSIPLVSGFFSSGSSSSPPPLFCFFTPFL